MDGVGRSDRRIMLRRGRGCRAGLGEGEKGHDDLLSGVLGH